jgi:hypothetical protein
VEEDLTIKARIDDELSAPLENIREDLERVGDEATKSGRRASTASRGWSTFGKVAKGALMGVAAGAAAAGYATYRLMRSSITEASNLNESLNAVNVSYGKQAKAVKQLGREAAKSIGMSNVEFNSMAVQFSSFAKTIGGGGKGTVKTLDAITTRAADFASVMNIEVAEATALFQSGLAGESEPLRKYGINLSAAAVGAYAVKAGLSESATEMTDAAKIQATYGLLMEKTSNTQGDFANTSDSLANSSRILSARFDNVQAKLGKALLPIMGKVVGYLNREGIPAFRRFSDWFTQDGLPAIERFGDKARTVYEKHLPQVKSTLADVRDVVVPVAQAAGDMVEAFLNMPSWARKLLIGGGVGAVIASKLKVPKLLNPLVSIASKAKPLPVFVVNNGLDIPGKPGSKTPPAVPIDTPDKGSRLTRFAKEAVKIAAPYAIAEAARQNFPEAMPFGNKGFLPGAGTGKGKGWLSLFKDDNGGEAKRADMHAQAVAGYGKTAEELEKVAAAADLGRAKAAGFGRELDLVGARKVRPEVRDDSIRTANDYLAKFISMQIDAGRPVAPYITLNGYDRAMSQINTLKTAMHTIPSAGVDGGVPFASGGAGRRNREYGGSVKAGEPYVVGERRAELFVPDRSGTVLPRVPHGGGGTTITVERGAIVIENPADGIDLERAITAGIKAYVQEREERR